MVSYCSVTNDRKLTRRLIESSTCPLKCFDRCVGRCEWSAGVDIWSSSELVHGDERRLHFHEDIGLYLPGKEKKNLHEGQSAKNDLLLCKKQTMNFLPDRLRQLFQKEKSLLTENSSSSSNDEFSSRDANEQCQLIFHFFSLLIKRVLFQ